jgi:hypothetical protein
MSEKRPLRLAVCTDCGAFAYNANHINQRCGKRHAGKRCRKKLENWGRCPVLGTLF